MPKALEAFNEAINLDPNFALAHVGIADYYIWLCIFDVLPSREAFPKAFAYEIALSDENDQAIEWLKKSKDVNAYGFNFAQVDPRFDKIRVGSRLKELVGSQ